MLITTKEIESLGWRSVATVKYGGTKIFQKKNTGFTLTSSSADNFIKKGDEKELITIHFYSAPKASKELVWSGIPDSLQHLKKILVETGADMEWLNEIRDEKIDTIIK